MILEEKRLNDKIHDFMDRKAKEYPELHLTDSKPNGVFDNHEQMHAVVKPQLFHGRIADVS